MLWPGFRRGYGWDPFGELRRVRRELGRLFDVGSARTAGDYPAVNVWTGDAEVVVTAELPGVDAEKLDVSVQGNALTIRGTREPDDLSEGETYHRQERGYGQFVRTVQLPYHVDSGQVDAKYVNGVLSLTLPRAEADKPRQIAIKSQ